MDMEYQGKDNDDVTAEGEDPLDWNPEMLLEHAKMIFWKRSTGRYKRKIRYTTALNSLTQVSHLHDHENLN